MSFFIYTKRIPKSRKETYLAICPIPQIENHFALSQSEHISALNSDNKCAKRLWSNTSWHRMDRRKASKNIRPRTSEPGKPWGSCNKKTRVIDGCYVTKSQAWFNWTRTLSLDRDPTRSDGLQETTELDLQQGDVPDQAAVRESKRVTPFLSVPCFHLSFSPLSNTLISANIYLAYINLPYLEMIFPATFDDTRGYIPDWPSNFD